MATRDVQLIVRARDEASRAFATISGAVAQLIGNQDRLKSSASGVSSSLASQLGELKNFDAAYTKIVGAADRAEASYRRQEDALRAARASYAATAVELRNLAEAQSRLQGRIVDQTLAGEDTTRTIAELNAVKTGLAAQSAERDRARKTISALETSIDGERGAMQQLASIANATEAALESLTAGQQREARAAEAVAESHEQAARRIAAAREIQNRIADVTGISAPRSSAVDSAAVFAADFDRAAAAAERLRQRTDPLYAIQAKLNSELAEAQALYRKGALSADELAEAERRLKHTAEEAANALNRQGRGEMAKPALFGLKPYELTNLGYQINDVFTQLASGTAPLQVLAQQGGQILQLIPGIGDALIKAFSNPLVIAGIGILATVGTILVKASNDAQRLDNVRGILAAMADGAQHSATELAGVAEKLEDIGLSAKDALEQIRRFLSEGLNTEYLVEFTAMAKQLAETTGKELPDAMDDLVEAFSGGYDAIAELDDELQFLTASERAQIRALFDSGKASEARELAVGKLAKALRDQKRASDDAKSGLESLTDGLDRFLDRLADTSVVRGFISLLDELGNKAGRALRIFSGDGSVEDFDAEIARLSARLDELKANPKTIFDGPIDFARYEFQVRTIESMLEKLRKERGEAAARDAKLAAPKGDPLAGDSAAQQKRRQDRIEELQFEDRVNKAKTDADKVRLAGEEAYREEIRKTGDVAVAAIARRVAEDKKRVELAKKAEKEAQKTITLDRPVDGRQTSSFGFRTHPVTGKRSFHGGIDIAAPNGTAVRAAADAIVGEVGFDPLLGKYVKLNHGKGLITIYGHLSDNSQFQKGDSVERGTTIGRVGSTGRSTGNHLHFAVRENGALVNPNRPGGRFRGGNVGDAAVDVQKELEKLEEQQEKFNLKIDEENDKRQRSIEFLQQSKGLTAEAIMDAERQRKVDAAIFDAEYDAKQKGLILDEKRRATIAETVGLEHDLANARERATAAVDEGTGERAALLELLTQARELGDQGEMKRLEGAIAEVEAGLDKAIQKAIDFWKTMGDTPEARTAIAGLEALRNSSRIDARERGAAVVQQPVDRLSTQRSELQEQIRFYQELGQGNVVEVLKEQLRTVNAELLAGIDRAIAYYQVHTGPNAQNAILSLQNMRNQIVAASQEFQISAGQIQQVFAGALSDSVQTFVDRLVETRNPLVALRDAALQFAADFLKQLGQILLQMAALQLASKIGFGKAANGLNSMFNAGSLIAGGVALRQGGTQVQTAAGTMISAAATWLATAAAIKAAAAALAAANAAGSAGVFHDGGIAGLASRSRAVSPAWFAAATRYHSGGIAGLRPNEVPAILERGEEILTRNDPRHRSNGDLFANDNGAGGGLSQILAVGDDEIANAMAGASGQRVFLTFVKRNAETIKQALRD